MQIICDEHLCSSYVVIKYDHQKIFSVYLCGVYKKRYCLLKQENQYIGEINFSFCTDVSVQYVLRNTTLLCDDVFPNQTFRPQESGRIPPQTKKPPSLNGNRCSM